MAGLNAKQSIFCIEYIKDLNATQAAIRAGYSKKTAGSKGASLMQISAIRENIAEAVKNRTERTKIDADWVLLKAQESFEINAAIKYNNGGDKEMINAAAAGKFLEQVGKHVNVQAFSEKVVGEVDVNHVMPVPSCTSVDGWEAEAQKHQSES